MQETIAVYFLITDSNDNFLKFNISNQPIYFHVYENAPSGSFVGQAKIEDLSSETNSKIYFKIEPKDETNLPFSINSDSGILYVANILDFEIKQIYSFYIQAINYSGLKTKIDVIVVIQDENDNFPRFINWENSTNYLSSNLIQIMENVEIGTKIFQFEYEDKDLGNFFLLSNEIFDLKKLKKKLLLKIFV